MSDEKLDGASSANGAEDVNSAPARDDVHYENVNDANDTESTVVDGTPVHDGDRIVAEDAPVVDNVRVVDDASDVHAARTADSTAPAAGASTVAEPDNLISKEEAAVLADQYADDVVAGVFRRRRNRNWIIALIALIAALTAGFLIWNNYQKEKAKETTVPTAVAAIPYDKPDYDVCEPFKKANLDCTASNTPNDNVPRGEFVSQSLKAGSVVQKGDDITVVYSNGPATATFPNLVNTPADEAKKTIYDLGLDISEIKMVDGAGVPENNVVSTSIAADAAVNNGDDVVLEVSKGMVEVPDWKGKPREIVETEAANLNVGVEFTEEESEQTPGTVVSQSVVGPSSQSAPVKVVLAKAFESKDIVVPDVEGMNPDQVQAKLAQEGFRHIVTMPVATSKVTSVQVTQTRPKKGETAKSEEDIIVVVSVPDAEWDAYLQNQG